MVDRVLNFVSPMPPARNGIADYANVLAECLSKSMELRIISPDARPEIPSYAQLYEPEQIFRFAGPRDLFLYQIGNNPDHDFVLKCLLRYPGVTTLHDLSLLHLHEVSGLSKEEISRGMLSSNQKLGRIWSDHQREGLGGESTRHLLLDMLPPVLSRSVKVVVHSEFAREVIRIRHGEALARKVVVIPHFAPSPERFDRERCRAELGLGDSDVLVLTAGFATRAKRFDWMIEALDDLALHGYAFRWVHAGEERTQEFPLSKEIWERPRVAEKTTVTGFLSEPDLDRYIGAADVIVNLRFPSVGESSGTLARSFAAGVCCVVSDTAAYAGIPRDRVVHVPVVRTQQALAHTLRVLLENVDLRRAIGERARKWAENELSIPAIGRRYVGALMDAGSESIGEPPPAKQPIPRTIEVSAEALMQLDEVDIDYLVGDVAGNERLLVQFATRDTLLEWLRSVKLEKALAARGIRIADVGVYEHRESGNSCGAGQGFAVFELHAGL